MGMRTGWLMGIAGVTGLWHGAMDIGRVLRPVRRVMGIARRTVRCRVGMAIRALAHGRQRAMGIGAWRAGIGA